MTAIACPHCSAPNTAGVAFCAACGKALPSVNAAGPRIVTSGAMASTAAGVKLQADELHKQAKKASGALLAVAIIQTLVGGFLFLVLYGSGRMSRLPLNPWLTFGPVLAVGVVFWALYVWSRSNPLPAAIAGLVVYVTVWVLDIVGALMIMSQAPGGTTPGSNRNPTPLTNGIILRIIIVAILVRAIQAGVRHRRLMRQQASPIPVAAV